MFLLCPGASVSSSLAFLREVFEEVDVEVEITFGEVDGFLELLHLHFERHQGYAEFLNLAVIEGATFDSGHGQKEIAPLSYPCHIQPIVMFHGIDKFKQAR